LQLNLSYALSEYNEKEVLYAHPLAAEFWHPTNMYEALLSAICFGAVGIIMAVLGFKLFDWITPGNLGEEITSKNNNAAAILAGAVVLASASSWLLPFTVSDSRAGPLYRIEEKGVTCLPANVRAISWFC